MIAPRTSRHLAVAIAALVGLGATAARAGDGGVDGAGGEPAAATVAGTGDAGAPAPATSARAAADAGLVAFRDGRLDEAAAQLGAAVAAEPRNAAYLTDLGFVLGRQGRRAEARALFERAIAADPARHYAYVNLIEIVVDDPQRFADGPRLFALLQGGQAKARDGAARVALEIARADLERSLGRLGEAQRRVDDLLASSPISAARKRALDLGRRIEQDRRALALDDWPESTTAVPAAGNPAADAALLTRLRAALDGGRAAAVETELTELLARPGVGTALPLRELRAQALAALGRWDEAAADLTIVTRLRPSSAAAWRRLGLLLAGHGGAFESARAREALSHALALEPSWRDLEEPLARLSARREPGTSPRPTAVAPSDNARRLLAEAEEELAQGDPVDMARDFLAKALADSPAFVEAASQLYAITGKIPARTIEALQRDGVGLLALATEVRRLGGSATLVTPWLDRAVELGVGEARIERALLRAAGGDRARALDDLTAYVASAAAPPRLDEARALRLELDGRGAPSAERLATRALLEGDVAGALRALGPAAECRRGTTTASSPELLALAGRIAESQRDARGAAACYRQAWSRVASAAPTTSPAPAQPSAPAAGPAAATIRAALAERIARFATWTEPAELAGLEPAIEAAADAGVAAGAWALARLADTAGDAPRAIFQAGRFLQLAEADDPARPAAVALRARHLDRRESQRRDRLLHVGLGLGGAGLVLVLLWLAFARGHTLAQALLQRPALYPDVSRAIAELRHDVLKHRISGLGLLGDTAPPSQDDVARTLLLPEPPTTIVDRLWDDLTRAVRGQGLALRRIGRDPDFGPLRADLARAERWVHDRNRRSDLVTVDGRLRGRHAEHLSALLASGPRTPIDRKAVARWIAGAEAEFAAARPHAGFASAAATPTVEVDIADAEASVPVDDGAVALIVGNLCRNALAAVARVAADAPARVIVRVAVERDVTGRRQTSILVGDSSPEALDPAAIEGRDGSRGLGLVRDTVRRWGGQIVVRPADPPLRKWVGASFPS